MQEQGEYDSRKGSAKDLPALEDGSTFERWTFVAEATFAERGLDRILNDAHPRAQGRKWISKGMYRAEQRFDRFGIPVLHGGMPIFDNIWGVQRRLETQHEFEHV